MARILSVGTAVPDARYTQKTIRSHCEKAFAGTAAAGREDLFDRAGVETRGLVEAPEYYFADVPFERRNADYFPHAERLARRALESALDEAGVEIEELTHLFSVTTTGLLTPSLDAHLAQALPFRRTLKRTPLFGAGCAGGAVALSRAFEDLRGHPEETVAAPVELCSLDVPAQGRDNDSTRRRRDLRRRGGLRDLCGESARVSRPKLSFVDNESVLIPDSLHDGLGFRRGRHAPRALDRRARHRRAEPRGR